MTGLRHAFASRRKGQIFGWLLAVGFIYLIAVVIPASKTKAAEAVMRSAFQLPASAQFDTVKRPRAYSPGKSVTGTVRFTPQDYAAYRTKAADPAPFAQNLLGR